MQNRIDASTYSLTALDFPPANSLVENTSVLALSAPIFPVVLPL
jgi:hypothetical protein